MQQAADEVDTCMAAVVKLSAEQVQQICERYSEVYPVNYNCPGQITVSGLKGQMAEFCADVKTAGGRAIPLKVKGGFHSPFMSKAAEAFAAELSRAESNKRTIALYSNLTAEAYENNVKELLSQQICNPVQWEMSVRNMITTGIDSLIEIGPGRTLTNMIKKIDSSVKAVTFAEYLEEVQGC